MSALEVSQPVIEQETSTPCEASDAWDRSTWLKGAVICELMVPTRAGRHLHANTVMERPRELGINLLGARNRGIQDLVVEVPAPVIAKLLGYSDRVTQEHAETAASTMAGYAHISVGPAGRGLPT